MWGRAARARLAQAAGKPAISQRGRTVSASASRWPAASRSAPAKAIILDEFKVSHVRLKLSKPGAVRGARAVGVLIERSRINASA